MECRNIRFPRWVRGHGWAFCSLQQIFLPIWKLTWPSLKEMFFVPRPHLWPPLQIPYGCWKCWFWRSRWLYFFLQQMLCENAYNMKITWQSCSCWSGPTLERPQRPHHANDKVSNIFFKILKKRDPFNFLTKTHRGGSLQWVPDRLMHIASLLLGHWYEIK